MAKRKATNGKIVEAPTSGNSLGATHIDSDDLSDFGIYGENLLSKPDCPFDAEGIPVLTDRMGRSYDRQFDWAEKAALATLAAAGITDFTDEAAVLDRLNSNGNEAAKDAWLIRQELRYLRRRCEQGAIMAAVAHAFNLGRFYERRDVRWAEPLVMRTRKMRPSTPAAQQANSNKADARHEWAARKANSILKTSPRIKREKLAERISRASKKGCGRLLQPSTVEKILAAKLPAYGPRN